MEHSPLVPVGQEHPGVEGLHSESFGQGGPQYPKITYNYQAKAFTESDTNKLYQEFEGLLLHYRACIRRNYEKPWSAEATPEPPSCYSPDGKKGSRVRELRMINGYERPIYGDCGTCWFAEFGTAGAYKDGAKPGPAPQCNRYALGLTVCGDGVKRMLHVPPTGVDPVGNTLTMLVNSGKEEKNEKGETVVIKSLYNLRYKFMGTGGGRKKTAISVAPVAALTPDSRNQLREMALPEKPDFDTYCEFFMKGVDTAADRGQTETPKGEGMS